MEVSVGRIGDVRVAERPALPLRGGERPPELGDEVSVCLRRVVLEEGRAEFELG